jgi:hypothetical protein
MVFGQQPSAAWHGDVESLWMQALTLLNEHDGYLTKQRFEEKLGVHLQLQAGEREPTTYSLQERPDSPLVARISTYSERFKSALDPQLSGAHVEWFISWGKGSAWPTEAPRRPRQGPCLKASQVRSDLLASGWTSPWWKWGAWEEQLEQAAAQARLNKDPQTVPHPPELVPPIYNFLRQVNESTVDRDRLPRGQIFSEGDLADSCVTGILVRARPPPH